MNQQMRTPELSERIHSLDVLRGFSLLGILLVNMISFHSPFGYYNPYEWWKFDDLVVYTWIDVLIQGSFYPIFAMMFGYGMAIMQKRSLMRGTPFYKISIRRLTVLLLFGIVHAFLIWHGDILITYALMGFLLLLFLRLPGRVLLGIGAGLYLLPQLTMSALMIAVSVFEPVALADFTDIAGLNQAAQVYSTGSFKEITIQRFIDWSVNNSFMGFIFYVFMILPLMMIGAGASKLDWLQKANTQKKKWTIILIVFFILGLAAKCVPFFMGFSVSIQYVQDVIGGPLLGIAYIAVIVLLMTNQSVARLLKPLASAGKMSISIYLMQSLIGTLIFYHYALGLYGKVSMSTGTWLAVAIYVIQVIFAELWLSKFKQGPVEKLWRTLTYGNEKYKRGGKNEIHDF